MKPLGKLLFVVLVASPAQAQDAEIVALGNTVQGREGERVVWENVYDRQGRLRSLGDSELATPIRIRDSAYYALAGTLFEVEAATGVVRRRIQLPGTCRSLTQDGDDLVIEVTASLDPASWQRSYRLGPGRSDLPFFPSGDRLIWAREARSDAEGLLADLLESDFGSAEGEPSDASWRQSPEARPYIERAVAELLVMARRDPTNPWYRYQRGLYLQDLKRDDEAQEAFASTLEVNRENYSALLSLALPLDRVDPKLGDEAFRRAMAFLMTHGYDPEMQHALIGLMILYGNPAEDLDAERDLDYVNRLAERIWDLAPGAEATAYFYQAVADANHAAGRTREGRLWETRVQAVLARVGSSLVPGGSAARRGGPALNALMAVLLALILVILVKGIRNLPTQRRAKGSWTWNPFAFWTRGELLGFLLVFAIGLFAWWTAARGLGALRIGAGLPIAAISGNYGHPEGAVYFERLGGTPGGDFIHALALLKADEHERAAGIFARLDGARALNNLGVIRHAQGQTVEAQRLFAQARAADSDLAEAAFNLGEEVDSSRIERALKYGLGGPLYAMPTDAMWDEALTASFSLVDFLEVFGEIFTTVSVLASAATPGVARADTLTTSMLSVAFLSAGLAALGLVFRPRAAPIRSPLSLAGWVLGLLVPGTARSLGVLGPPLLAVASFSALAAYTLADSGGVAANFIDAIALPNVARAYGLSSPVHSPLETATREITGLWWILWIVNLGAVLLLELRSPDPCGPRGASQPNAP